MDAIRQMYSFQQGMELPIAPYCENFTTGDVAHFIVQEHQESGWFVDMFKDFLIQRRTDIQKLARALAESRNDIERYERGR